jgi:alpha-L-arabinofuranosidase
MTTPAPLFAHVDGWQWRPDQIWYDNTDMFKTVSYYVQQMYATNAGTNVLSLTMNKKPVANQAGQNGLFASAAYDSKAGEVIIKIANTSKQKQAVSFNLTDVKGERTANTLTLCHNGMDDENSICKPELITPQAGTAKVEMQGKQAVLNDELAPMSFRIYRFKK